MALAPRSSAPPHSGAARTRSRRRIRCGDGTSSRCRAFTKQPGPAAPAARQPDHCSSAAAATVGDGHHRSVGGPLDGVDAAEEHVGRGPDVDHAGLSRARRPSITMARGGARPAGRRRWGGRARRRRPHEGLSPSISRSITSTSEDRIRSDPPVPSATTPPSGPTRIDGLIIDPIRCPGGVAWNPSGFRSASPSMLFSWMPVPGTTKPEVTPLEVVIAATMPSASTALRASCRSWQRVNPPGRRARSPMSAPSSRAQPAPPAGERRGHGQRVGDDGAAEGRGRVGEELVPEPLGDAGCAGSPGRRRGRQR